MGTHGPSWRDVCVIEMFGQEFGELHNRGLWQLSVIFQIGHMGSSRQLFADFEESICIRAVVLECV